MSPRLRDNPDDLEALLGQAADALNRPFSFLEKDFWAMEVLRVTALDREIALREGGTGTVKTVFKGGTSLSRVYQLIDRFSEDIDILVSFPADAGGSTEGARDRLLKSIEQEVHEHLGKTVVSVEVPPEDSKRGVKRTVKYHYPVNAAHPALAQGVKLEMGSRGGPEPMTRHPLRSIIANYAIDALGEPADQWEECESFDVNVLGAERTLIEKLSAVHTITSDSSSIQTAPAGWGRHFSDIHHLLQSPDVRAKLVEMGRDGVVQLVLDIEEHSKGHFRFVQRPGDGYASSPAFDSDAPVAQNVREAYEAVAGLMYDAVVPLEECLAIVHTWAELV